VGPEAPGDAADTSGADDVDDTVIEPPWWRPARPGRRRQPLSRRAIIDAAVRILDDEGADALTVRRLGAELNTGSATLYWHIAGTEELRELVYDDVMGAIVLPPPDPARWQEQIRDLGRQAYAAMLAHREVVRYSIGRVPVGPNMLRVMEWTIGLLRDAGVPPQPAAFFGEIFGRLLDVSVLEESATGGPPPELIGQYFAGLPPERFPHLIDAMQHGLSTSAAERFTFGLDLLIAGLAALAE
jgi:AcrR family transcriptional regulator